MLCTMGNISKLAICPLFKTFTSRSLPFANGKRNQMQIFKGQALFAPEHKRHEKKFNTQMQFLQQGTLAFRNLIKINTSLNDFTYDVVSLS